VWITAVQVGPTDTFPLRNAATERIHKGKIYVAKEVIMPALGMAQETGTLLRWFKSEGDSITKGEPLMEVETDKAAVEIEAPASGTLSSIIAHEGDVIPVGQRIAVILAPGESDTIATPKTQPTNVSSPHTDSQTRPVAATPVALRLAAEHNIDLAKVKTNGGQIRKEDILAYIDTQNKPIVSDRILASPKARRLARENNLDLNTIKGTGPDGAVLVSNLEPLLNNPPSIQSSDLPTSRLWRGMAERLSHAWTTIPHFYLVREVNASRLVIWREKVQKNSKERITYTDLLVKLTAAALRQYPRLNSSWIKDSIVLNPEINIGLAVAVEDGLLVPVIHHADELSLSTIAARRAELVTRAQANKLTLDDLSGGTFTISNLGMYGVDAFNAIVNPPQAAILAVSRIADRIVPVNGQPAVQPMVTFSLSCDHRAVDGARGAQFLQALADFVEEPLQLLN
jgi:pyruvate dehydrogenase E2 component (dihydrolipoamide acetyltransferase)